MTNNRIDKLQIRISEHVSTWIVLNKSTDINLIVTTIHHVVVSKDLSHAKVFITSANDTQAACQELNAHKGQIRLFLSHKMSLKKVPELQFYIDHQFATAQRVNNLLDQQK